MTWIFRQREGPVVVTAINRQEKMDIADEYMKYYANAISSNIYLINCSNNSVISRAFFEISESHRVGDPEHIQNNLWRVIESVFQHFSIKRTLYILEDAVLENKLVRHILKLAKKSSTADVLITVAKMADRGKYVVLNYDDFKSNGIMSLVRNLNPVLRRKYSDWHIKNYGIKEGVEYDEITGDVNSDEYNDSGNPLLNKYSNPFRTPDTVFSESVGSGIPDSRWDFHDQNAVPENIIDYGYY